MKLFFGPGSGLPVSIATHVRDYLPEDRRHHYRDGRSMAEAAKCWVAAHGNLPVGIEAVVGRKELIAAHFEYPTKVWGNGTAMTDVMAFLSDGVIAVEAKVEEPFDQVVRDWINERAGQNPASPPHRIKVIERYAQALSVSHERLLNVRYQLLQRTLCAALAARHIGTLHAWMIVQSFSPHHGDGHRRNRSDFDDYVTLVGNAPMIDGMRVQIAWVSQEKLVVRRGVT